MESGEPMMADKCPGNGCHPVSSRGPRHERSMTLGSINRRGETKRQVRNPYTDPRKRCYGLIRSVTGGGVCNDLNIVSLDSDGT